MHTPKLAQRPRALVVLAIVAAFLLVGSQSAMANTFSRGPFIFYQWSGWGTYCNTESATYLDPGYLVNWNGVAEVAQWANPCPGYPPGSTSGYYQSARNIVYKQVGSTWVTCTDVSNSGTAHLIQAVSVAPANGNCGVAGLPSESWAFVYSGFGGTSAYAWVCNYDSSCYT